MSLSNARLRYLSAIGAMLPSLTLAACKDPAQPPPAAADSSTTPATATVAGTSTAPTATAATATVTPPLGGPGQFVPCPNGAFCISAGAKPAPDAGAPAPYEKCAATAAHPEDAKDSGFKVHRLVSFSAADTATERTKNATACCYTWVTPCPGGRAFRDATGTPSVARPIERTDWVTSLGDLAIAELSLETRASLADHWTREAAFEHASIASFAQLTLDLLSVGAPPELLEATQRATLDEIEHARITFALAAAYGARPVGPAALAALPGASRTLASIARSTFIDACVGESVASASLAEGSRKATDPVLRDLLAKMAADEERHAELAWRIVAWALRSGDPEVAQVLSQAMDEVIAELVSLAHHATDLTDDARTTAASTSATLRATVLREVVLPCTVALLTAAPSDHLMAGRQTVSMHCSLPSH